MKYLIRPLIVFMILMAFSVSALAAASDGQFIASKATDIIRQVNFERAKYGLDPLKYDPDLTYAASMRAVEISRYFSHTRPDGTSWRTVSPLAYSENIARGHKTTDKVMAAWLTSPSHRKSILKQSYSSIGVAAYRINGIMHWVQLFGKN